MAMWAEGNEDWTMSRPGSRDGMASGRLKVRVKTGKGRTVSQKNWLERQLNDPYVHEARKLGYRSRAAFKLTEIDDKYKFLKPGGFVVDLGAAPGGWSQVSAARVKSVDGKGRVVAIDMHGMDEIPGVIIFKKDFYDEDAPKLLVDALGGAKADCVLSDMAAHATGHRQTDHINIIALVETGYHFAQQVLKPGGTYLAKVLRGGTENQLLALMKKDFAVVRHVKPMASRDDSAELFVLATGFRG
jgi:23S rRNA (uridine2552-2'-O)-methyltransferase